MPKRRQSKWPLRDLMLLNLEDQAKKLDETDGAGVFEELKKDSFYLQDKRQYVGNDMLWWAKTGSYTCDISKAQVFTKKSAFDQNRSRETDIPWPCDYINKRIRPVIDMQYTDHEIAMQEHEARCPGT